MNQKIAPGCCDKSSSEELKSGCCRIESLITIDERGQMVLPKELRDRAGLKAGDKLALISWDKGGDICCFTLIKSDLLGGMIQEFLGPLMGSLSK